MKVSEMTGHKMWLQELNAALDNARDAKTKAEKEMLEEDVSAILDSPGIIKGFSIED